MIHQMKTTTIKNILHRHRHLPRRLLQIRDWHLPLPLLPYQQVYLNVERKIHLLIDQENQVPRDNVPQVHLRPLHLNHVVLFAKMKNVHWPMQQYRVVIYVCVLHASKNIIRMVVTVPIVDKMYRIGVEYLRISSRRRCVRFGNMLKGTYAMLCK